MTTSYPTLKPIYLDRWHKMKIRPARSHDVDHDVDMVCEVIMDNKKTYLDCQTACHGIPWWFFPPAHYREGSLNFGTYLGNGQSLRHRTTEVPVGRGPFPDFPSGAYDAMKIQGFVGATDWCLERACYRWEGFNGFGYEGRTNPPYLYAGSTVYGPPESTGGLYIRDHVFDPHEIDHRLGTVTILKRLMELDKSIVIPDAIDGPQPDDKVAQATCWAQAALNHIYDCGLDVDGKLGPRTMRAVRQFQEDHSLIETGLLDALTMDQLREAIEPAPPPNMPPHPGIDVIAFIHSLFRNDFHPGGQS